MPDTDPNAEIKAETARLTAEAALVTAKAQLTKAQADSAAASQPPDPLIAAATAEKARLEAQKAVAQAAMGLVTGSTAFTGAVETKPDAGKGEATLLASRAIKCAAASIAKEIKDQLTAKSSVVLMQGAEAPQFANYRQFLLQESLTAQIFTAAENEANRLSSAGDAIAGSATAAAPPSVLPPLTTADLVLNSITKLGSYFMSNYEIGGITLTPDGEQLVSAVANQLIGSAILLLPARAVPQATDFADTMEKIATKTISADSQATRLDAKAGDAKAKAEGAADADKAKLQSAAKLYEQGAAVLRKAIAKSEEFIATLSVPDAKGVAPITRIAQERAICVELQDGALALVLDVRAMVGGYYTKKNLWTFLGCVPFYVMGGAVVTYCLVDKKGEVMKAGLVPVHGGYAPVHEVDHMISR
jgi:hypothetical protein